MKKNKIFSLIMTMVMVCALFISTQKNVQASDIPECVDGSYLTNDDSSEVTVGPMSRGIYLKSGSSNIVRAGTGKIGAGGNTVGQKTVSKITVDVTVERGVLNPNHQKSRAHRLKMAALRYCQSYLYSLLAYRPQCCNK